MGKEFEGKTIFITGAAKGQGKAVALAFAKEGANIVAFDLGEKIAYPAYNRSSNEDLENLKDEVEALGGKIVIYAGDVRKDSDVKEAVARGAEVFGTIDILFSNAGIAAYGNSYELEEEQWDAVIDINLKGGWLVSKYVIPHMIKQKKRSNYLQFFHRRIAWNESYESLRSLKTWFDRTCKITGN